MVVVGGVIIEAFFETGIQLARFRPKYLYRRQRSATKELPYTTVFYHPPPGAVVQARLLENQEGANTERYVFGKALGETFPASTFLAPTLFQPWRHQPWKIGPGVCDLHQPSYTGPNIVETPLLLR